MSICLKFDRRLADQYRSPSQKARVLTEGWVKNEVYCPNCGNESLEQYSNSKPVADFFCKSCSEDFELKSKKNSFGQKIVDGEYETMLSRLSDIKTPNLFLLNYDPRSLQVLNLFVIPKHFFVPEIVEERKPLSEKAERSRWVGCNILLGMIPQAGKIFLIKDRHIESKERVVSIWQKTLFLRDEKAAKAKGWLLDVMRCIELLGRKEFSLADVYQFETILSQQHPDNRHIKDKIRQQLQFLRDRGYLKFIGQGKYSIV
jgi:type II restriction enzyme